MKKSLFFPILALILCIGFSSCKPNEKEYTCFFKIGIEEPVTEDSVLLAAIREEHLSVIKTYQEVFNADRGFHFVLAATDEDELKAKISDLNQQVVEQLNSIQWKGHYDIAFYMPKDEKESIEIFSTELGITWDQGTADLYGITYLEYSASLGYMELLINYGLVAPICYLELDNWGSLAFNKLMDVRIVADLNKGAGGADIFLHGAQKCAAYPNPITDVIVLHASGKREAGFTYMYKGKKYVRVNTYDDNLNGDLNQGAGGPYLYLMYTHEGDPNHKLANMCIYTGNYDFWISGSDFGRKSGGVPVPMINESNGEVEQEQADFNKGVGGRWIRMLCQYSSY